MVGFLDPDRKEMLEYYKNHFDIVCLGEADYDLALYIIKHILGLKQEIDSRFETLIN